MLSSGEKKSTLEKKDIRPAIKKIEIATQFPEKWQMIGSDPIKLIVDFSHEDKDAASLAQTCRFLYHSTHDVLQTRKLKKLAHFTIVEPNEIKVTAMLTLEPTLVDAVIKEVIDNSGRIIINNKIFQLAYGASDGDMCLAIKQFFTKAYGSEDAGIQEMEKQRKEKFAENKEEDDKADKQAKDHLAAILKPAIEAITNEGFNSGKDADGKLILSDETLAAIKTFREKFIKSQPKRIEKGMHFRINTLQEIFDVYAQAQGAVQWNYNSKKCALFEDGILSCVLEFAPANDAQKFSQGLYYLQKEDKPERCQRSLALRIGKNNFYRSCRGMSVDFSLLGSCVDILFGHGGGRRGRRRGIRGIIKIYVEQKRQTCRDYACSRATPEVSVCNLLR